MCNCAAVLFQLDHEKIWKPKSIITLMMRTKDENAFKSLFRIHRLTLFFSTTQENPLGSQQQHRR